MDHSVIFLEMIFSVFCISVVFLYGDCHGTVVLKSSFTRKLQFLTKLFYNFLKK